MSMYKENLFGCVYSRVLSIYHMPCYTFHNTFCFQISFCNEVGRFDLEVTTFQMAVLFAWNQRPRDKISYESLKLATELPDAELRRTLWVSRALDKGEYLMIIWDNFSYFSIKT